MARAIASYGGDADALAADHQHVFGIACPPYESALLEPDGSLGGEVSDRARRAVAAAGVSSGPGGEPPDHLSAQLYALALVSGAEADAIDDGKDAEATRARALARHLLDGHLLRWLPSLAIAVARCGRAFPSALVETALDVALQHRSVLGAPDAADLDLALPPIALSLHEKGTGLDEIAALLARPARAGALLGRDDVARLGRASRTPRGFGDRATMIENLLRTGAQLGSLGEVIDAIAATLRATRDALGDERLADVPPALVAPWRARLDETCEVLERLRSAYGPQPAEGAPAP
jgi:TorA maturation chaperone TorD